MTAPNDKTPPKFRLTEQELIDHLEEIVETGSATARIAAIKELRKIRGDDDSEPPKSGFDDLG